VERLSASEIRFIEHFQREINKVNKFSTSKINELENILADCIQRIMASKAILTQEQLKPLEHEVDVVAEQVVLMSKFLRQNKIGFHNIVKKYEKQIGGPAAWLLVYLEKEAFWNLPLDHLIVAMSEIYRKIRAIEARTGSVSELKAQSVQTFQRKCFKFWVRPEDVPAVKALVCLLLLLFSCESAHLINCFVCADYQIPSCSNF
jgi:SPX domain protein involved in polyphosphate accumulation